MNRLKVVSLFKDSKMIESNNQEFDKVYIESGIEFTKNVILASFHYTECCENHWLDFEDLKLKDFEGLEFDLSNENFFKRIPNYGIELIPINGHSIKIPGYDSNNGYYSIDLNLLVVKDGNLIANYNITECQDYNKYLTSF